MLLLRLTYLSYSFRDSRILMKVGEVDGEKVRVGGINQAENIGKEMEFGIGIGRLFRRL